MDDTTGRSKQNTGLLLYLITFIISSVPALFLTAPPVEDALGTMASAAYISGVDYREFLAADGFFYKYGQALWYLPVFLFVRNAVIRYKVMLIVNSALDAFVPVIAHRIASKYLLQDARTSFLLALITGMCPSMLLYDKYTWAEPVLFLMPWVVTYLLLELKENERGSIKLSTLLVWSCVYAFMSHQRGIVLVIATVLFLIIYRMVSGRNLVAPAAFIFNLVAALAVDRALKYWLREVVYLGVKPKHNTLAAFLKPEIYHKLFSAQGQAVVFKTAFGWLYNCAVSTMGVGLLGLFIMCALAVSFVIRKKVEILSGFSDRQISTQQIISLLGTLLFIGSLLLGILFF